MVVCPRRLKSKLGRYIVSPKRVESDTARTPIKTSGCLDLPGLIGVLAVAN